MKDTISLDQINDFHSESNYTPM